jgi:hypothetical protein
LLPRPFTGAGASTTGAGTGFSTVAWHDISNAMRCLPMFMMMRFWGSMTGCGEAGADWGKGITLFVMPGDCTSQPPAKVRTLAAFAVAYLVGRSVAPGASAAFIVAAARR